MEIPVPSIARLRSIDDCKRLISDSFQPTLSPVLVLRGVVEDREGSVIGRRAAIGNNELPDEVVKSRTKVVENIPDDDMDTVGNRGQIGVQYPSMLTGFSIELVGNSASLRFMEGFNIPFKLFQMFLRTCYLRDDTMRSRGSHAKESGTENSQGSRDSDSNQRGIREEPGQGNEASEGITATCHYYPPPTIISAFLGRITGNI